MRRNENSWIGKAWLKRQYGVYYKRKLMFYKDFLGRNVLLTKIVVMGNDLLSIESMMETQNCNMVIEGFLLE